MPNDTAELTPLEQQLAIEIQVGDGANARLVRVPIADTAEGLALLKTIIKTPGRLILGEHTAAPMLIDCRHVVFANVVLLPPTVAPPKLARIN